MVSVTARVDKRRLDRKIAKSNSVLRKVKSKITSQIIKPIDNANRILLKRFLTDQITQEILGGPNMPNISGTLGGRGNLFTFIGFEDGSDPIGSITDIIANSIRVKSIKKTGSDQLELQITVTVPSKEEIFDATPFPWAVGKSWAEGIERGMSGLGYYLYSQRGFKASRSGKGIQLDTKVFSGGFRNQKYISTILRDISVYITRELKRSLK